MPELSFHTIVTTMLYLFFLLIYLRIFYRFLKSRFSPVKKVKATVIDKHTLETFSKYRGDGKVTRYVVVFSSDKKKLSFYVSGFSYGGYKLKESGTLTYRGDRIIDFS